MSWTPNTSQLASNSGCQNGLQSQHIIFKILGIPSTRFWCEANGSWIESPIPQKCSPPGGYRMAQIAAAISSEREIGARLIYYGDLLIHCFGCEFAVPSYRSTAPALPAWSFLPRFLSFLFHHNDALWLWRLWPTERKQAHRERKHWMSSSFFIHFGWGFVLQWLPRHITGRDDVADTVPLDKRLSLFPMAALPLFSKVDGS